MLAHHVSSEYGTAVRPARGVLRIGMAHLTAFTLFSLAVAAPFVSSSPAPFTGDGNSFRQISYLSVFVVTLFAARVGDHPKRLLAVPMSVCLVLAWCWLSVTWAINPDIAMRRLLLTSLIIWAIFILVDLVGYESMMHIMRRTFIAVIGVNYLAVILLPSFGIHQVADLADPGIVGSWRGVMLQKNYAGGCCALSIIILAFDVHALRRSTWWISMLLLAFFLFKTNSKTSAGVMILSIAAGYLYKHYNPRHRVVVITGIGLLVIAVFTGIETFWDEIAARFNTPDAFTGRIQIWPPVLAYYRDHWIFGAGYGSFWNVGSNSPIYQYTTGWVSKITSAHNGFIDLLTQIGLPGVLLVIFGFIVVPVFKLLASRRMPRARGALLLAIIIFCVGDNMTESSILDRDALVHIFLVFAVAMIRVAQVPAVPKPVLRPRASPVPAAAV